MAAVTVEGSGSQPRRRRPRSRAEIERERQEHRKQTAQEIDRLAATSHRKLPRKKATSIGAIYARYSSRHQESVADQVRVMLEDAVNRGIFVPREYIFFDLAVKGYKKKREGLDRLRPVLSGRQVQVLLLFATNRIFRKVYRTLEFADQVVKEWRIRCIFVKTGGLDSANKDRWDQLLHFHAMHDEFVVTMYVENIRAAHEGLMLKRLVFGTISFGYGGEPIPGEFTRRGKPRRRLIIDPFESQYVLKIFDWYVRDRLPIDEIVRRLNDDPEAPLPPRCTTSQWNRNSVKGVLKNARYRGLWEYGNTESVFVASKDYTRQDSREKPLRTVQIEELRLLSDEMWYAAQQRLAEENGNRGRRTNEGTRRPWTKLLHGLFWCPEHKQKLYVVGRALHCRRCKELKAENQTLYSTLNCELALKLTCEKLADLVRADEGLVQKIVSTCREEAAQLQRPDESQLAELRSRDQRLTESIQFALRNPGETEADRREQQEVLRQFRGERAEMQAEIARLEAAAERTIEVPTEGEVRGLLDELAEILSGASLVESEEEIARARDVIHTLTGGRIELAQQGERRPQQGWLQGRFRARLLDVVLEKLTGVSASQAEEACEVVIDYKQPSSLDADAERVKELYDTGYMEKEIAREMNCGKSNVTKLLKHWYESRGLEKPDGRRRRSNLERKQTETPKYKEVAEEAKRLWEEDHSQLDISRQLGVSPPVVVQAIEHWHSSRGLPIPDLKTPREEAKRRARELFDAGREMQEIAAELGRTTNTIRAWLKDSFAAEGREMPDRRKRRRQVE